MQDLIAYGQKTMTAKEIAELLNVNKSTIQKIAKDLFPHKIQHGVTTHYSEEEATLIKKQVGTGRNDCVNVSTVRDNVQTRLEKMETIQKAIGFLMEETDALRKQVAESAPKVEAFDKFISTDGTATLTNAFKQLGMHPNKMIEKLRHDNIISGKNVARERYIAEGYFVLREISIEKEADKTFITPQTRVTTKGIAWLAQRYAVGAKQLTA